MFSVLLILAAQTSADGPKAMIDLAAQLFRAQSEQASAKDYRVADDEDLPSAAPTSKDRAFAENGQRCAVIGAKRCTSKPRTIFSAPLN